MSSTPNASKTSSTTTKKIKPLTKANVVDFESLSLPSLKKYRSQFQMKIKPTVPKSELAAAVAEHFASIPNPEETEVIDQFMRALQKARNNFSETEESADDSNSATAVNNVHNNSKSKTTSDLKKKFNETETETPKNSTQSNTKKLAKRNSIPKVEKSQTGR